MSDLITSLLPIAILAIVAGLSLLTEFQKHFKEISGILALLGFLGALILVGLQIGEPTFFAGGDTPNKTTSLLVFDDFSRFFSMVFLIVGLLVALAAIDFMKNHENPGVFFALLLLSTAGMVLVASCNDLISLFVSWELGSIPAYGMVAFRKRDKSSNEAAMKFFLLGAMSSALTLYGISLVYGLVGSTNIYSISSALTDISQFEPLHFLSIIFLVAGFGFKMGVVPFHMWIPDTYQGAPTVVTAFLAAGSKKMGFAAAFRIFVVALTSAAADWSLVFSLLAIITMTLGNVTALVQKNIKRMLAYSSIGHAGYMLIAFAVAAQIPSQTIDGVASSAMVGAFLHVLVHALMKIVAFIAVIVAAQTINSERIEDYAGFARKQPLTALALAITLFSMAGIPPLGGFVSKFIIFFSAIDAGMGWLAFIAIINSVISVWYYVRVIKFMYINEAKEEEPGVIVVAPTSGKRVKIAPVYLGVLIIATLGIFGIGIYPQPVLQVVGWAIEAILPLS